MGVNNLDALMSKQVYFDTNPIIYIFEGSEKYLSISEQLLRAIEQQAMFGVTGELCLAEILVKPIRNNNNIQIQNIKRFFTSGFIRLLSHNRNTLELAAHIRATKNLKMVDAIHVATAIDSNCDVFITADNGIVKKSIGVDVFNLNDFIAH